MPEHFHLLLTEPKIGDPSVVMKVIKQRFARRFHKKRPRPAAVQMALWESTTDRVWQKRFYDFNVWSERKRIEKLGGWPTLRTTPTPAASPFALFEG